jgi:hypothetical protein
MYSIDVHGENIHSEVASVYSNEEVQDTSIL